jgi:hypothetical protein
MNALQADYSPTSSSANPHKENHMADYERYGGSKEKIGIVLSTREKASLS